MQKRLVIPDWRAFTDSLKSIYDEVAARPDEGKCADYIPGMYHGAWGRVFSFGFAFCCVVLVTDEWKKKIDVWAMCI